jgi:hypothetical protein
MQQRDGDEKLEDIAYGDGDMGWKRELPLYVTFLASSGILEAETFG